MLVSACKTRWDRCSAGPLASFPSFLHPSPIAECLSGSYASLLYTCAVDIERIEARVQGVGCCHRHHVGSLSLDFDRGIAAGMFNTSMSVIGASEIIMIPYLTLLIAIVRFGVLAVAAAALVAAAGLAAMKAYSELRRFIVLFRYTLSALSQP